jgi:cytochrome c oxidase subunit IV
MSSHPITSTGFYFLVFIGLVVGTLVTYFAALVDFGIFNTVVALTIAVAKATLVVWFFMGVRYNTPLTKVVAISGFLWLLILFFVGMSDYLTRSWIGVPGR